MTSAANAGCNSHDPDSGWMLKAIHAAIKLHGADVERTSLLSSQLRSHVTEAQLHKAIEHSPAYAGISPDRIAAIARRLIRGHALRLTGEILLVGIPSGPLFSSSIYGRNRLALLPAIELCQQLAYLYGWHDLRGAGKPDEDAALRITLLLGVMLGFADASRVLLLCGGPPPLSASGECRA